MYGSNQVMKKNLFSKNILYLLCVSIVLSSCSGSKKYYKAGEKLEKQGLVNEAAEFYLESLKRNKTNTNARIKVKQVGQKYLDFLSSKFFREYNTADYEAAISTFEKLTDFYDRASALGVDLNYPTAYKEDYQTAVNNYVENTYNKGLSIFKQKKYKESLPYFEKVKKYRPEYKKLQKYYTIAACEPLYQSVVADIQNKNYQKALQTIQQIHKISDTYKDTKELETVCISYLSKNILIFRPNLSNPYIKINLDKNLTDQLINTILSQNHSNYLKIKEDNTFGIFYYDAIENNKELLRAIAKATNADYFLTTYINNKQVYDPKPQIKQLTAYQQFIVKSGENVITEYKPILYQNVKMEKSYSFNLSYKIVQTNNIQTVVNQFTPITAIQQKEYNEFLSKPAVDIKKIYPYNPAATPPFSQYNPNQWRDLFFVNKQMKSDAELEQEAIQKALQQIKNSLSIIVK